MIKNWKTSALGVGAIAGAIGVVANMLGTGMWDGAQLGHAVLGFSAGVGLLFAKDHDVTGV